MIFIRHDRIKRRDALYDYTEKYAAKESTEVTRQAEKSACGKEVK